MGSTERGATVRQLDALFDLGAAGERTDRQLLDRFAGRRDEAAELAFAALVERHGPMVLRICRAVLRDGHDAQDAFQATFLVLVRRGHDAFGERDSLGPWLGGVAYRTAQAARSLAARRRRLEARAARSSGRSMPPVDSSGEVGAIVREEVDRLPERFRPAVALCLLDGQTIVEAARTLGCPVGTLQSRLARGRSHLRGQLARRGIGGDGPIVAPLLPPVYLPEHLARLTVRAATRVAAGATLLDGTGSAPLAALVRKVLVMMTLAKLKTGLIAAGLILGSLGVGGMVVAQGWGEGAAAASAPPGFAQPPSPALFAAKPAEPPAPVVAPPEILVAVGQSVQAAIDAAPEGVTLRLAAGEYPEAIVIRKTLTLLGAGWDKTVVGPTTVGKLTQRQKDDFFARLEAASSAQERNQIVTEIQNPATIPSLAIADAKGVVIEGIRWRAPLVTSDGKGIGIESVVNVRGATATLRACAFVGPYSMGIVAESRSHLNVERSLIAGFWGTGLAVLKGATARISDSDVRNCYSRCITLATDAAIVERSRISGSAWHGIRYDNCSPTIERCQIFGNARSGIYASGTTKAKVEGNVFWRNEMSGMSCWFANADDVNRNTFAGNKREGFAAIGGAKPELRRNVFVDQPEAIICAKTSNRNGTETPIGAPAIRGNVFFRNPKVLKEGPEDRPFPEGNTTDDPRIGDEKTDFRPTNPKAQVGAPDPAPLASPFPIQPGETAIIPDGETRDSTAWKTTRNSR